MVYIVLVLVILGEAASQGERKGSGVGAGNEVWGKRATRVAQASIQGANFRRPDPFA